MTEGGFFARMNSVKYQPESKMHMDMNMFARTAGSVIPKSLPMAFVSAGITIILGEATSVGQNGELNLFYHPFAYSVFAFCVTFTLIFRTQISYMRYWEACTQIVAMCAKFNDSTVQALTFDNLYPVECNAAFFAKPHWDGESVKWKTNRFRRRFMHLISLLHAACLHQIRWRGTSPQMRPFEAGELLEVLTTWQYKPQRARGVKRYEGAPEMDPADQFPTGANLNLSVMGGITMVEKEALEHREDKLACILLWIIQLLTERKKEGGMRVEPPILTRVFQELSNGMLGFNQAYKIVERPFPFCYTQLVFMLLFLHSLCLPLVLTAFIKETWVAAVIDFVVMITFFALEICAREIENCFGTDANDLDLAEFQHEFNVRIMALLTDVPHDVSPLRQMCSLPEKWDVAGPDLFLRDSAPLVAPTDPGTAALGGPQMGNISNLEMGSMSYATTTPVMQPGGMAPVLRISVEGTYDEVGGRNLHGIRMQQKEQLVSCSFGEGQAIAISGMLMSNSSLCMKFGESFLNAKIMPNGDICWENNVIWRKRIIMKP